MELHGDHGELGVSGGPGGGSCERLSCDGCPCWMKEAYSMARQFNQIPPICEQAEYHMFQREKVEVQLPELSHKIGECFWAKIRSLCSADQV